MNDFDNLMEGLMHFYNRNVADPLGVPFMIPDRLKRDVDITDRGKVKTKDRGVNWTPPGTEDNNAFKNDPLKERDPWVPVPHEYSPDNSFQVKKRT